ncbi:MAG: helix-turn-helix transcriptional regulator, partial [Candidatus Competibacteraceae bacterium]|nr:helix-turn-helix transcriptional regulator [Candidatus Competibacteraceae bacterium]
MKKETAITALAALAQDTRLDIFRYLMEIGPEGAAAGKIAEHLEVPAATLSFHLKTLQHAGLILRRRQSQSLIYSANFEAMDGLLR